MRAMIGLILFVSIGFGGGGCSTTPKETRWRVVDEGTFTMEIPTWLRDQKQQGIDSHCGLYRGRRMQLDFDECEGLLPAADMVAAHERLAKAFKARAQDENSSEFIRRMGARYARFTIRHDAQLAKKGFPGAYRVEVYIPEPRGVGGSLVVYVTYRDPVDTDIALRIVKSVTLKKHLPPPE